MSRARPVRIDRIVLSCEHGGSRVPARHRPLFQGRERMLSSHRGWDPGALDLARLFAERLDAPLISATVTRLLVDLNRSADSPTLFSPISGALPEQDRQRILAEHYRPYREEVEREVRRAMRGGAMVLHLSVHSFTPVLRGVRRGVDVGLLFDPRRPFEAALCNAWLRELRRPPPDGDRRELIALPNQPYRGTDDGLTTSLRAALPPEQYLGIEIEVNQRFPRRGGAGWPRLQQRLAASLAEVVGLGDDRAP